MDSLVDENEGNPLQLSISSFVEVDGSRIYKSTLVSELNDISCCLRISSPKSSMVCFMSNLKFDSLEQGTMVNY